MFRGTPVTERQTVTTDRLRIAVEISGEGEPIVLLHGWPDDARTYDGVLAMLHDAGYRTIVPFLRGFGPTEFLPEARRSGDLEALGADVVAMLDAMGIGQVILVGHDWGARAGYIAAHAAPERVKALVAMSVGWGTNDPDQALSLRQVQNYWYHWYFATPRGEATVRDDGAALARHVWSIWAPDWDFSDAEFETTARSFENPDWAEITLQSYRVRWRHAPTDPAYDAMRAAISADPTIRVPTLMIHGGADPCTGPESSEGREAMFAARYERVVLDGLGHFPQREDPQAVARAILNFLA